MYLLLIALLNKPKRTNTENYLREFKAAQISLNKVRDIKSREFKAERKWVQRECYLSKVFSFWVMDKVEIDNEAQRETPSEAVK